MKSNTLFNNSLGWHRAAITLALVFLFSLVVNSQSREKQDERELNFDFEVEILRQTGPDSNRVKLTYASDGYTGDEINTFPGHVKNSLDYLMTPGMYVRPLPRYKNFINVYRIDLLSEESGISVAPRYGRDKTKTVRNALGGSRDNDRLGWVDRRLAGPFFDQVAMELGTDEINWPFVVLNNPEYHNSGGRYVVFSYNFGKEIGLHEAGHGFFGLADEYYGDGEYTRDEPRNINVTADPSGAKWFEWLGYTDIDTALGVIDVYEGAIYASKGAYRPSRNSKMGWTSDKKPVSFNAVCRQKIILDIYDIVNPVDDAMDTGVVHVQPSEIWLKVVDPAVLLVDWYINGKLVKEDGGQTFIPGDYIEVPGSYIIKAHVYDEVVKHAFSDNDDPHPLDLVRTDLDKLQQDLEWMVKF
ncbi:MAG: M64 family metallopeptidase [Bacteroidales bacterium]|nr:M64 family metallopeptidase [Bacteroidales bacterium]